MTVYELIQELATFQADAEVKIMFNGERYDIFRKRIDYWNEPDGDIVVIECSDDD